MHASERTRNVVRTIMAYLVTVDLAGCVLVPADDATFDSAAYASYVRVRVDGWGGENAHRLSGDPAEMARFRVVAECYVRNGEGSSAVRVDDADAAAEAVAAALRSRSLPLLDYVTDPTGATAVTGHTVRFSEPPTYVTAPSIEGWSRRIVTASGWWVLHHTTG